ncbi:MAG: sigma-70 family RNA polymerase sigma factor [Candidatus Pelethousia sp.]|nr:sigma-70 family RNA polymerase sigma factor [Candidatus Pelethousia sp.]
MSNTINLRNYYPFCETDVYVDLPDEIMAIIKPYEQEEQSYRRRMRRYKVCSLDEPGMENQASFLTTPSAEEIYEQLLSQQRLYAAIKLLPDKQRLRICKRFLLSMSIREIASVERVHPESVRGSIERGLRRLEKILAHF